MERCRVCGFELVDVGVVHVDEPLCFVCLVWRTIAVKEKRAPSNEQVAFVAERFLEDWEDE